MRSGILPINSGRNYRTVRLFFEQCSIGHEIKKKKRGLLFINIPKEKIARTSGALIAASAFAGATAYLTTRFFVKTALNRENPKIMEKAGNLISGCLINEEIPRQQKEAADRLAAAETEPVEIKGYDGVKLVGHWYPCETPQRIVIAIHGWMSSWCNDF